MAAVTTAVIGIAGAAYSAAQAFEEAEKQKEASEKAARLAATAMKDARSKAEKDPYAKLSVPLDAYEQEFEQNLAASQQSVEALQEGDSRALAGGVGRVGAQSAQQAEDTRIAMGEDMFELDKLKAESKDAINQQLIEMDVANAKEQNQRQRDSQAARAQAIQSGVGSISSGLQSAASLAPLYGQSRADIRGGKIASQYAADKPEGMSDRMWAAKMGDQNFDRSTFKKLKAGEGIWDSESDQFNFGHNEPVGTTYKG